MDKETMPIVQQQPKNAYDIEFVSSNIFRYTPRHPEDALNIKFHGENIVERSMQALFSFVNNTFFP
jgi:hypothetical protein